MNSKTQNYFFYFGRSSELLRTVIRLSTWTQRNHLPELRTASIRHVEGYKYMANSDRAHRPHHSTRASLVAVAPGRTMPRLSYLVVPSSTAMLTEPAK